MNACPICGTPYAEEWFDHEFGIETVQIAQCDCAEEE